MPVASSSTDATGEAPAPNRHSQSVYAEGAPSDNAISVTIVVLCIDDDVFHSKVLSGYFEQANASMDGSIVYDVHTVSSGDEALAAVQPPRNLAPDIVLMDVVMDDIMGDELLPKMRQILGDTAAIVMASIIDQVPLQSPPGVSARSRGVPRTCTH